MCGVYRHGKKRSDKNETDVLVLMHLLIFAFGVYIISMKNRAFTCGYMELIIKPGYFTFIYLFKY